MNTGDSILVNVDPTLGDGQNWRRGTFISQRQITCPGSVTDGDTVYMVGIGEKHYFNYEEKEVYPHSVKRFIPLTEEAAKAKHSAELDVAFEMVQAALVELMPGITAEIKDGSITAFGVTLDPVVYETPRIGAVQETAGWQVHVIHYNHATREQPEDYEPVEVGTASQWSAAVRLFVETILKQKAKSYWEHLADVWMTWADDET